MLDMPFLTEV